MSYEQQSRTAALVMDYPALVTQAQRYGEDPLALLERYRKLGVNGVALYENTVGSRQQAGLIYLRSGAELAAENPGAGFDGRLTYLRELVPGAAADLLTRYSIKPELVNIAGQTYQAWTTDPQYLPAGPDTKLVQRLQQAGYVLVYRPYDDPAVLEPAADWPQVPFVAFNGTEVPGVRVDSRLELVNQRLEGRVPALIEATEQRGLDELVARHGAVRMFSLNPAWQERLLPEEVASKYALAASERSHRLLYFRPYPTTEETETMLARTREVLQAKQVTIGTPEVRPFQTNLTWQALAALGPLAALLLLGLSYPLPRVGLLVAALAGLGALALNGFQPLPGLALIAAITFPALGFVLRRSGPADWLVATGLSLAGVLFVSALGANAQSVLGLEPFRGVGLTLLAPLAFVALSFLPRQDIRKTAADLYRRPLTTGDVMILGVALVAFAVMFLRRGNTSSVGVSDAEARIRQELQDSIVRPRFKELAGHPLALLGLGGGLPGYLPGLLLLGGVMGQASILNTFSHFHTPLLISAARCFIGLAAGLVAGILLLAALRLALRLWQGLRPVPEQA
ncbi:DUF5693 family protein [Deinococcus lacus]|uniref:DUF5693 family protein n=1 Tax=Deinococcus lacus TaxID=392561 RepID=A0ABW1YEU1_9DEIO